MAQCHTASTTEIVLETQVCALNHILFHDVELMDCLKSREYYADIKNKNKEDLYE